MKKIAVYFFISVFIVSCNSNNSKRLDLTNSDIQNIIEFQDTKNIKELIKYFVHPNMELRERACIAFGSIQDSTALTSLYTMLEEDEKIASAAAFAIGQTGNASSLPVLKRILERSMNEATRYQFFVAIGKCGDISENYFLTNKYNVGKDARGTAWALFYLSRNKFINESGIALALKILENEKDDQVRLGAAHAIGRSTLDSPWESILPLYLAEENKDVKIALAAGLRGITSDHITTALLDHVKSSPLNSQINFIRSAMQIDTSLLLTYTSDLIVNEANINLQLTAADYIASKATNAAVLLELTDIDRLNWRVRNKLLEVLVEIQNDEFVNYARSRYESSENLYERGELLTILSKLNNQKDWLKTQITNNDSIISTYGIAAYAEIIDKEDDETKKANVQFLIEGLGSKNDAVIFYAADLLRDSLFLNDVSIETLKKMQSQLSIPKKLEAYNEIEKTIRFYQGVDMDVVQNEFNHPIIKDSIAYLESIKGFLVSTSKGDIIMDVNPFEAPGTVMSIARIVESGYYNGKLFHRVVPNFVIQTGCPYGDGWGGLDYTMRSEFTRLLYTTGAVGMASSGQDTESCQWFITHSPTPHLNGRYTIFAYVSQGMDVVQTMEVGDRILKMSIIYK